MTETLKCTVGPSAVTGLRCGKPAVVSFTSTSGEVFAECEDHALAPASTPAPVAVKRGVLTMPSGSILRTTRSTRYVLAAEYVIGSPRVLKGSSSIEVLRKARTSKSIIFDLTTGGIVS